MKGLLSIILLIPMLVLAQFKVPTPKEELVHDYANVLSDQEEQIINNKLVSFEHKTSIEIAVVTVASLEKTNIDSIAEKMYIAWGIGKRYYNNGILYLLCPTERTYTLKIGSGLLPYLPSITENIKYNLNSSLRERDYYTGIMYLSNNLIRILKPIPWKERQNTYYKQNKSMNRTTGEGRRAFFTVISVLALVGGLFGVVCFILAGNRPIIRYKVLQTKTNKNPHQISAVGRTAAAMISASNK